MRPPSAVASFAALGRIASVTACAAALVGCRCDAPGGPGSSAGGGGAVADAPAGSANASPEASEAGDGRPRDPHAAYGGDASGLPPCRVMSSENGPSPTADATAWLDVAAKGSFTVKVLESGRELRFEGPGRIRPCTEDVALVAEGAAIGLPGSGEAPGAEQWVATACGVARWASGVHRVVGGRDGCKLQSSLGTAHLFVAEDVVVEDALEPKARTDLPADGGAAVDAGARGPDGSRDAWRRVDAKRALRLRSRRALDDAAAVRTALVACEKAAQAVQTLSGQLVHPRFAGTPQLQGGKDAGSTDAGVGELAEKSVSARGVARAACAVAAVRVAVAGSRPEEQARLDAASARWRR
jgi:hypothetical protein